MTGRPDTSLRLDKKLIIFVFYGRFYDLLPIFLCYRAIRMADKTLYMIESYDQTIVAFAFYGCFHKLLPIILGFQGDLK